MRWWLLVLVCMGWSSTAQAQQFWKKSDLLGEMFPASERIAPVKLTLDDALAGHFQEALGYRPPRDSYTFYVATTGDAVDGYALFDDQIGQHEPITFGVQLSPQGEVVRLEVVVYREKYGAEVRHPRFREQFTGRSPADAAEISPRLKIVSGATYSSKSMAIGVERAIVLTGLLVDQQAGS